MFDSCVNAWGRFASFFSPPSASVIAARELEEHKRQLLAAKKQLCWADKNVKFHTEQIAELTTYLKEVQHG